MVAILLAVLGLVLGSFILAMVDRMRAGKDWVRGRSQCDHCGHQLSALDLVPLFSWLFLSGRCRYCQRKLTFKYPMVELATAIVFVASYLWWPASLSNHGQQLLFLTYLASCIGLIALAIYDLSWMLLPNKLIYPTFLIAAAGRLAYILAYAPAKSQALWLWLFGVAVASGIFWLLFVVSGGRWIGYGDVRLGLVTGTLLADPKLAFLMIFTASILGTLVSVPLLIAKNKKLSTRLPFGPFLISATFLVVLFGPSVISWYQRLVLL